MGLGGERKRGMGNREVNDKEMERKRKQEMKDEEVKWFVI